MFALTQGTGTLRVADGGRQMRAHLAGVHFVVPRILRRPIRLGARLMTGEVRLPRFSASILTAALIGAFGIYGTVAGGHAPAVFNSVTSTLGFAINDVIVTGHGETSEIDILGQLGLDGSTSLIGFDAAAARVRIGELPWVGDATVRKVYPDRLEISLTERQPFAIWQHGSALTLIERNGNPIVAFSDAKFAGLPLVVGLGAAEKAAGFVETVQRRADLAGSVKGYIRVADRRWDLRMANGITIRLPEKNAEAALDEIGELDRKYALLERDIEIVDLRDGDRLVLKLSPEAAIHRSAAIRQRMQEAGKGKRI